MPSHKNRKSSRDSKLRDREKAGKRGRDGRQSQWEVRRYRVGTLAGPAYVEFKFPTEGGGTSRLCVPNSDLRHMNALLDQFANFLPILPLDVLPTDAGHKKFIHDLLSAGDIPLELVPMSTGFIDRDTFVTHGEIIRADGTRVARPRLDEPGSRRSVDVSGTQKGRANRS